MNTNPAFRFKDDAARNAAFHAKIDKSGGDDACWPWTGFVMKNGYGQTAVGQEHVYAHRRAFELSNGAPAKSYVLHTCDNRGCCNPKHLYDGTQQQNMQDMNNRGRAGDRRVFGRRNGRAKLSDADVESIRAACEKGEKQKDVAARFKTTQTHVSRLVRREQRA